MARVQIGLDEAGYGPILGPFVMTAVTLESEQPLDPKGPWKLLGDAHRPARCRGLSAGSTEQFWIADSKQIHRGPTALARLEFHTLPILWPWLGRMRKFDRLIRRLSVAQIVGLELPCYDPGRLQLPLCHQPSTLSQRATIWRRMLTQAGLKLLRPRVLILLPQSINAAITRQGTKAVLPVLGLARLLPAALRAAKQNGRTSERWNRSCEELGNAASWEVYCDRFGGRHHYASLLADILDGWLVQTYRETRAGCEYRLEPTRTFSDATPINLRVVITPRAEAQAFVVALASMISKYIREVFMYVWNQYWRQQVPGLRPTAGYPGDARRFLQQIEAARIRLGLDDLLLRRSR